MRRKRYTGEQIASALRQAESGTAVEEICRKLGISEPTFYLPELPRRRPLRSGRRFSGREVVLGGGVAGEPPHRFLRFLR
jgi:transposase-like protein